MSLIKCPQCGNPTSSMAATCRHCKTPIYGNLVHCPSCKTIYLRTQQACPECGTPNAPETHNEEKLSSTKIETIPQQTACEDNCNKQTEKDTATCSSPKPTSRKKWSNLIYIFIGLMIGAGYCYYDHYFTARLEEHERYEALKYLSDPSFFQQFLEDYPESFYYNEVNKRLTLLLHEDSCWQHISKQDKAQLTDFMHTFPGSIHNRTCLQMIDSIEWKEANEQDNKEAVNAYLQKHPEGIFAVEATEFLKDWEKKQTTAEEKTTLENLISHFLHELAEGESTRLKELVELPMQVFIDKEKVQMKAITQFIQQKKKGDARLEFLLASPLTSIRKQLYDSTQGFEVTGLVEELISLPQKESKQLYRATYHINNKLQVVAFQLEKTNEE